MSTTIDERVVEMRFDNKQFEAGVATSLNTLDRLKKGLDLDGAAKGFDSLGDAAKKCDVSALGQAAEAVSTKFSALETIAVGALLKIGSQAVSTGEQLLKSLTIDNITAGWEKYSEKTTAVQTIMAATGKSIDEVNGSLEKLIWFTDETSYSMTDMTSNIGKFTSQGVDLDTAVTAMEGISTWASLSGGSINEARHAMYNLSQALGVGAVKLQDWKSIENANMATKEFKEMAMEAAVATGDLTKSFDAAGNAIYKTSKGTEVSAANFSSTLSDAWFTSDALMGVLNNYGSYADGVYELYNNLGDGVEKTTSEIISDLKKLQGADDQTILNAGYTEEQIELVHQLSEQVGGIGQKSFAAAQEAKTFTEVLDSVKEAVASGWSQTFETIFGNYEEAKVLWTDLANALWDVFASGGEARNELLSEALSISGFDRFTDVVKEAGVEMDAFQEKLSEIAEGKGLSLSEIIAEYGSLEEAVQNGAISSEMLREAATSCAKELEGIDIGELESSIDEVIDGVDELSGRQHLIAAFWDSWESVGTLLSTIKDAFHEVFPATTAEQVFNFTKGLHELTGRFKTFLTETEEGQALLTNLKNTFSGIFAVIDIVRQAFSALWRALTPAGSAVGGLLSGVLGLTGSFGEWLTNLDIAIKESDVFYNVIKKVVDFIGGGIAVVKNFASAIGEMLNLPSFSEVAANVRSFISSVKEKIGAPGLEFLRSLFEGLSKRAQQVRDAIVAMKDGIVDAMDKADSAVSGNRLVQVLTGVWNLVKSVASAISGILGKAIDTLINTLRNADFNGIMDFLNALAAGGLIATLKKFLDPMNELKDTFSSFGEWLDSMKSGATKILDGVRGSLEAWQTKLKADAIGKIATAVGVLAVSLLILSSIDSDKLAISLAAMAAMFVELSASMAVLNKLDIDGKGMKKTASAMVEIGAALLILSIAMKNIADLDPAQLAEGLIGIGVLLAELAAFLKIAEFSKGVTKTATGLVILAAAIKILASAVKDFAVLSWEEMAKGLVGVGVLLAEVDIFLNTAKFSGKSVLTATGIVILAAAIKILASAVKDFSGMSLGDIIKGLAAVGLLLAEITAFTKLTGDSKHVISTGLALIEIAAAMKIFASAMKDFGSMSFAEIAKGLIAMGGAIAEVAIATKIMPKNMVGIGLGLIAVGAALKIIASVLGTMGGMSWEEIAKGLVALGGALAELSIALNLMNGTLKGSAALLVAAGALAILTPALIALGSMSWESIAKGLITIAGAFTIIGVAAAVLSPLVGTILALSAALAIIGVSAIAIGAGLTLIGAGLTSVTVGITALASSLAASVTAIVAGLSAIVLGIAGLIPAIAEKIGEAIVAFCGIIANGATAIAGAVKAVVLSLVDMLVTCIPTIADGALQMVVGVLAALVAYTPQIIDSLMQFLIGVLEGIARNMPQLIQAAMDVVGAFFAGILNALSSIDTGSFIETLEAVGLLTGIVAALGLVAGLIPAAMVGVVGLGAVATELALVLTALGGLAQIPGLQWLIGEGGQLLQTMGAAIGGLVGSIVGGFMNGVSSSFPQIGSDLSAFMTNVQPFIDGASGISPALLTGIENLTAAILLITAADLVQGLTSWLTGGSSLADFGNELVPFGEAMAAFSNTLTGLDIDVVSKAAIAGKTLAEMAANLPNSGGAVAFFTGNNDMDKFGDQLVVFGDAMVSFGNAVEGLKTDAVQNAAIAGKAMAEMAATLPNSGGAVAFFTGNNDMSTFGEQLVPFGKAIKEYSEAVDGLNVDAVVNSATAGQALVELANTVPNAGGAVAFFTGDNDLSTFGENIIDFGWAMKEYAEAVDGLEADVVINSTTAGAALVELANTLPNTGGLISYFAGDNDLATFGKQIVPFGEAMKEYSDTLSGFSPEAVTASASAGQALAELSKTLPNTGGLIEFFTGGNDLGSFAEGLIPFGEGMKSYGEAVSGLESNADAIEASIIAGQSLIELSKTLPNVGSVIEFFTGSNDLGTFSAGIQDFGIAMKQYGEAVSGLENYSGSIDASVIAGNSLIELSKTLPNVGSVIEFFTGSKGDLAAFGSGITSFGGAMKAYGDAVNGLEASSGSIEASVIAGSSLVELAKTLPNTGGVLEFFDGSNDLGSFSNGIVTFGETMKSYADAVAGLEAQTGAIKASVVAGQSLIVLSKTLPNSGSAIDFFTSKYDLATFGGQIVSFGNAMAKYADAVSNVTTDAISASTSAGASLVELAKTLPNCDGLVQVFTGSNSLASFGDEIVAFGEDLAEYAEVIRDVTPESVTASANAAQALSDLANGLPDRGLLDKWFGGNQTLDSFGRDISAFGQKMGDYYSTIENINVSKLSGVIDEVWSIVDVADAVQNIDSSALSNFSGSLKALADSGITEFTDAFSGSSDKVDAAVREMLNSAGTSIVRNKDLATNGITDMMTAFSSVVTQKTSDINVSVTKMMAGVSGTIRNNISSAKSAMQAVMRGVIDTINSFYNQFYNTGAYAADGLIKGMESKKYPVSIAGRNLALAALDAAKQALDSHSPSKKFIYLGENIGEGLAIGIDNSIVPAAKASSGMIDEVLAAASNGIDAFEEWLDEKKYYDEIGLTDELAGWEELQRKYAEGSEERKKIDREVYRVQNEIVAATYQKTIDWIEEEKYYNRLSKEEELALYEEMQTRYLEGTEERKKADREVYRLKNELLSDSYQNMIDWIEEEKYYNRLSKEEELAMYEEAQATYEVGTEERKKADREVYRLQNELVSDSYQNMIDWIEEEKYYNRLSKEEELAMYEEAQATYEEGTEERKKADREVYRLRNELVSDSYQSIIDWIEEEKYYNRLSKEEELALYEEMQATYLEGSEERKKADREVYRLRNELMADSYQHSMDWIEEEKYYNRMSLADELAAYTRVQQRYAKGTNERKKMDREVYRLEKEIYEAEQQYLADVQAAQENAAQKRLDLEQEYADKVKEINEQLAKDIETENNRYLDALESRTDALYGSYGLFDAVKEHEEVSGDILMGNLEDQVKEFSEWQDALDSLSARGVEDELIEELQKMGPSSIAQIKALVSMSNTELNKYVSLWQVKHGMARAQAVSELEGLRQETLDNIDQLRENADTELADYCAVWQKSLAQVNSDAERELSDLYDEFAKKVGLIKTNTEEEMAEMAEAAQRILREAGWDETGQQIVEQIQEGIEEKTPTLFDRIVDVGRNLIAGLTNGVESEEPTLLDRVVGIGSRVVGAFKSVFKTESPSRETYEIGQYVGAGLINGMSNKENAAYSAAEDLANSAKDGLTDAMYTLTDYLNGDLEIQPTIRPVLDLSDISEGTNTINNLFRNRHLYDLASQTSLSFSANTGDNELTINVNNDGVVQEIRSLRSEMAAMADRMERLQVVLDSGTIVGELAGPMDEALGQRSIYRGRRN